MHHPASVYLAESTAMEGELCIRLAACVLALGGWAKPAAWNAAAAAAGGRQGKAPVARLCRMWG